MTFLKAAWYAAAWADELDEGLVSRKICNEPIVLFRTSTGEVAALADRCPHRFVPLSMGKRVGDTLQCGYHGLSFDASGACADAPNDSEAQKARICVRSYPAVERYSVIWLWLGERELADPALIPSFDFLTDTAKFASARGHSHIKANYQMLTDNLLDLSHVHYLHPDIHEGSDYANFTNKLKIDGDTVWSMLWRHHYYLSEAQQQLLGIRGDDAEGQGHSRWNAPGNLLVETAIWERGKSAGEGVESPSAHLLTPETEYSTHYFWASARTFQLDNEGMTRATATRMRHIFETQDGPMCEAQQAAMGANTDLLAAKPVVLHADAAGLAARRILRRKLREEAGLAVAEDEHLTEAAE